jgi:ribosomal protein S18 acetylase RimI-like enzyme
MTATPSNERLLDNAVWHTLKGPLAAFASDSSTLSQNRRGDLVQFDREVNVFDGVEKIDDTQWRTLATRLGSGGVVGLFRDVVPDPPPGWETHYRDSCFQMLAADIPEPAGMEVVQLGAEDVPEMLELAELTEPGPFSSRTIELGRYIGVRDGERLLAMAGERFRVDGFVEISAVCTHPDARGRGLAAELTLNIAQSIRVGGDEAFLHVIESNENAVRLYQKLGFIIRRKVDVVFAEWHSEEWQPELGETESAAL